MICGHCCKIERDDRMINHTKTHHYGTPWYLHSLEIPLKPMYTNWKLIIKGEEWVEPVIDYDVVTKY